MKRPHKYRAKPIAVDGIRFASKAEARRYGELKILERAGSITHLELQPRIRCVVNEKLVATYIPDFAYFDGEKGRRVYEDVKSLATSKEKYYRLKRRLVNAIFPGVLIEEIH